MTTTSSCLVCGSPSHALFQARVLGRHLVSYFQCSRCQLVHTEKPYWLQEAYTVAISAMDVGLVARNIAMARRATQVIQRSFDGNGRFLDYAGGYGMFVRLMRDAGYDFYRDDLYCTNLFAQHLDLAHAPHRRFELVTAFEVFEHMVDPLAEAEKLMQFSDTLLFSTELIPGPLQKVEDWWYFVPETGQHIVFFSLQALQLLAQRLGCQLYSNCSDLHLMTRRPVADPFVVPRPSLAARLAQKCLHWAAPRPTPRPSLLQQDFEAARQRLLATSDASIPSRQRRE